MLDSQDEQFDRRLATHLVSLYHQSKEDEENVYMVSESLPIVLMFLVIHIFQDEQFDRRLATHLVSLYHQSKEDEENVYMVSESLPIVLMFLVIHIFVYVQEELLSSVQ